MIEPPVDGGEQTGSADITVYFQNKVLALVSTLQLQAMERRHIDAPRTAQTPKAHLWHIMASGVCTGQPTNSQISAKC